MAKKVTNYTCPIFIETTFVDILIYSDFPTQTIQEPQSGVFCILISTAVFQGEKVVSRSAFQWHIFNLITSEKVVVEKGQITILLKAYLLDFILDFLKLYMKVIVLFKPDPTVESACLCLEWLRNDSLPRMAIFHHENSRKRLIFHHFA